MGVKFVFKYSSKFQLRADFFYQCTVCINYFLINQQFLIMCKEKNLFVGKAQG